MFNGSVQSTEDAILYIEATQVPYGPLELTDTGDGEFFTSSAEYWSMKADKAPIIMPNGVVSGCYITPSATNNVVKVTSGQAYQTGYLISVALGNVTCNRTGDAGNPCIVTSIVINATGVVAAHQGLKGASLSFTRGAAGGPPLLAAQEIELGQVKYTSEAAAIITTSEIYQIVGVHRERYDMPGWKIYSITTNDHSIPGGTIRFDAALGLTHVGNTTKHVYATYSVPTLIPLYPTSDFRPSVNTHNITSVLMYEETVASWDRSLTQGSFTYYPLHGAGDWIFQLQDQIVTLQFCPDPTNTRCILTQGALSINPSYPAGDHMEAECIITAPQKAVFPQ